MELIQALLVGWLGMFGLTLGMKLLLIALRLPPYPDWLRIPFELAHNVVAGLAGGWLCLRRAPGEAMICAVLLAALCSGLEYLSLKRGWTTFDAVHAFAGMVLGPTSVVAGVILMHQPIW